MIDEQIKKEEEPEQPKKKTKRQKPEANPPTGGSEEIEANQAEDDENQSEAAKLAQFVANAVRAPRAGIFEQLLSQHLATAVITADPLKRTRTITAACLMVQERDREDLGIDYELVGILEAIANALLFVSVDKRLWNNCVFDVIQVSWGFALTEESFNKYILPWAHTGPSFYAEFMPRKFVVIKLKDYRYYVEKVIREPQWEWFFEATRCLTSEGLTILRNQFSIWAMPKVQAYLTELTGIVSPSVYSQILGLARRGGKKDYAEKVNEIAGAKTENEDGSRLG